MTRTIAATEAKNRLGSLLRLVNEQRETVIIESRREPVATLIPVADYEELQALRKEKQRSEALAALQRIAAIQAERNKDLTDEEAQALVDRAIKDIREDRKARARNLTAAR